MYTYKIKFPYKKSQATRGYRRPMYLYPNLKQEKGNLEWQEYTGMPPGYESDELDSGVTSGAPCRVIMSMYVGNKRYYQVRVPVDEADKKKWIKYLTVTSKFHSNQED